jgi:RimJ/RimL family protein N-acetyltransferase
MFVGKKVRMRPKRQKDAFQDYSWRKDPELVELDAATPVQMSYEEYAKGYVWELEHPAKHRRRFSIETMDGKYIGHCAFFDMDEERNDAQLGIMVADRNYWGKGYGTEAVKLLLEHGFNSLQLRTINLRSLDWNIRAHKSFLKSGFATVGERVEDGLNFVIMRITREEWEKHHELQTDITAGGEETASETIEEP